jgi:integrase
MDKKYNYLDMKNNEFIFNNYKTDKTYKSLTVKLDDDLIDIIKTFLKYHPNRKNIGKDKVYLLVDENGEYFKNINSMTRFLYKIFGRKIGVSMLRKIYLTDKYKETVDNLKKDAVLMGNSIDTILNNYIKQ